jgi:hypothetical protein
MKFNSQKLSDDIIKIFNIYKNEDKKTLSSILSTKINEEISLTGINTLWINHGFIRWISKLQKLNHTRVY